MAGSNRQRTHVGRLVALAILVVAGGLGLAGCGGSSAGGASSGGDLTGTDLDRAQRLYAQLKREHSLQRDRKSLDLAGNLLDYYPNFPRNDEVLVLAVDSATRLRDGGRALGLTDEFLGRYPASPLTDQVLLRGAEVAAAVGDTARAAGYMISYHDRDPARGLRADGTPRAAPLLRALDRTTLEQLFETNTTSDLWPFIGLVAVQANLAEGRYAPAGDLAARLQKRAGENRWTMAALELLGAGQGTGRPLLVPAGEVHADRIGVMVPLTGRFAVLGNAFYDAALLAAAKANEEHGTSFELKLEDTGADPVQAVLAARRLCGELGSMAVVGGLLSDPTAAAAVVCDMYGVPLVSPTATNESIWKIGPAVFQTNLTGLYEVRLLAQLATSILLKKRFAIIHPDTPEGQRDAQVFTAEIDARGGEVVASASYPPQGTDFKDPILKVRKERPEAIFAPATVDQMVLLGPQLDFYRAGSLVLGLSNWNSGKLRDQSGTVLERAIFPDDLVLFPDRWEDEFFARWNTETYPPEATAQALKAYQAVRMLLDTMVASTAQTRGQLAQALERRLSNQDLDLDGPQAFGPTMRMFRGERIVPFPAGLFSDGWRLTEAAADTAAVLPEDGLIPAGEGTPVEGSGARGTSGQG